MATRDGHPNGAAGQHPLAPYTRITLRPIGSPLPLGRRARALDALEGPLERQLDALEHEAGVRQQL